MTETHRVKADPASALSVPGSALSITHSGPGAVEFSTVSSYKDAINRWNGKPYYSLDCYLKDVFHEKIYKLAIDGGFTCPNRDGTLGTRGCIFCSEGGSGDFAARRGQSFDDQIREGKKLLKGKNTGNRYIAYFQAYTNTYAPLPRLRQVYFPAARHPEVAAISIGTRPDCISPEIGDFLQELSYIKPVWIELGLQTIHEDTARRIRRGYSLSVFEEALGILSERNIPVIVHTILGLPGESPEDMESTARYLASQPIQGIKPQLLHVLQNTDLAELYEKQPFHILTLEEYTDLLIRCIEVLPPNIVIHRITGDGPKSLLIAPTWSGHKKYVMNYIHKTFKDRQTWQGRRFPQ